MFRRNSGQLPAGSIAGIMWDIVTDVVQYFYTFPSEEEFSANPQKNMPASEFSVLRILLSANCHVASLDTPKRWLLVPIPHTPYDGGSNAPGQSRKQQQLEAESRYSDRNGGGANTGNGNVNDGANTGNGGVGADIGRGVKREHVDTQVRNMDMHPILKTMM